MKLEENTCVYRELKNSTKSIGALGFYCPRCGNRARSESRAVEHHEYDDSYRQTCPDCRLRLNERVVIVAERGTWDNDHIDQEIARETLFAYFNRAMRYGYRLGDRIAVDARAAEFEYYAEELDEEWDLNCPLFRLPIEEMDNEGLNDTEFNHSEYEDENGHSQKQNADGFTLSRAAHDYVHYNLPGWVNKYYLLDGVNCDIVEFQAYRVMQLEKKFYEAFYGETHITDETFLTHVSRRYDYESIGGVEWLAETYEKVDNVIDEIHAAYSDAKEHYIGKMAERGEKGVESEEEAREFIEAKEDRIEEYLEEIDAMLEANEWTPSAGWSTGIENPTVNA